MGTATIVADVQPDSGGPLFRATFKERLDTSVDMPDVGERVRVRLQAGSQKVELDKSELRNAKKQSEQLERDRFAEIANASPGSPPPTPETPAAPDTQSTLSECPPPPHGYLPRPLASPRQWPRSRRRGRQATSPK
jgi:hypothetical protein